MGKVPSIRHNDTVVTECAAICVYLADVFPDAELSPPPADRGDYYRWLFFAAGPLEAAVTNRSMGFELPPEGQKSAGYGSYDDVIDTLEATVANKSYIARDRFSAADVYVGSQIGWGLQFGTLDKRAAFEDYWARLHDREVYVRASNIDDAALADSA